MLEKELQKLELLEKDVLFNVKKLKDNRGLLLEFYRRRQRFDAKILVVDAEGEPKFRVDILRSQKFDEASMEKAVQVLVGAAWSYTI